jgi:tetratricopeptide (TPR) repeat protein
VFQYKEEFMTRPPRDKTVRQNQLIKDLEKEMENNMKSVIAALRLGMVYRNAERLEDAEIAFKYGLELDPLSFEIRLNLSTLYFQMGRLDDGIKQSEEALNIRPESTEAMANIGAALIHLQRWKEAADYFNRALEIKPEMITALANLVTVNVELDDLENAIAAGEKAISLAPKFGVAHNNLAVAYYYHGDYDLARDHLEQARKLGYKVASQFEDMVSAKIASKREGG